MSSLVAETRVGPYTDWSITMPRVEVISAVSNSLRKANGEGLVLPRELIRLAVEYVHVTVPNQNNFVERDWQLLANGGSVRMPPLPDEIGN